MANGDLLRQLFRGYAKRDDPGFRSVAETIIKEERAKNHRLLADDLERILFNGGISGNERRIWENTYDIPKDRERGFPLVEISEYSYDWDRLVVSTNTLGVLKQIAAEYHRKDLLAAAGLKPKQRVLLYGPPGCGKTLAAQVIAAVLVYPLVTVRFDAVVSSFLGETAANLRRVFDFIQRGHWVVLFDEFDAIGKDRDNPFEHGELKRVVNTLLLLMDAFRGESLLIAATNHEGLLDSALWRRFEAIIPFSIPSEQDRILLLRLFLKGFDCSSLNLSEIGRRMKKATGSDIERVTIEAARLAVLDGRTAILEEDICSALKLFEHQMTILRKVAGQGSHSRKGTSGRPDVNREDR